MDENSGLPTPRRPGCLSSSQTSIRRQDTGALRRSWWIGILRILRWQEGRQAWYSGFQHLRIDTGGLSGPEKQRARRNREGIQDCDRDVERGSNWNRCADGWDRAGKLGMWRCVCKGTDGLWETDRGIPGHSVSAGRGGDSGGSARLMVYNAARLKDAGRDFLKEAAWRSTSRRRSPKR
jgi:hypothetical protein